MQMIQDAISPEQLALAKRIFDQVPVVSFEQRAEMLDARLRKAADLRAEGDDRNRFERRRAVALERAR